MQAFTKISRRSWKILIRWTLFGTIGCIGVAVVISWIAFRNFGPVAVNRAIFTGTLIPVLLAGPLFFYLSLKLRELAIANHKLEILASIDSLTGCLNRRAFSELVDRNLSAAPGKEAMARGALLVIDADHFKAINDRFGHSQGDAALRIVAGCINGVLRGGDFVGRLGGEEFAVFLPGANAKNAGDVAERIRAAIQAGKFLPEGRVCQLSVSVGGVAFARPSGFEELFRVADTCLYEAKNAGRNRVILRQVPAIYSDLSDVPHNGAMRA